MMTHTKHTAIQMVGTILLDYDLVTPQGLHDGSPAKNAREQAADLIEDYMVNCLHEAMGEEIPASVVTSVISDLLDEVGERTGERPDMPVAFATFRC